MPAGFADPSEDLLIRRGDQPELPFARTADCVLSGGDVERVVVALAANEGGEDPDLLMGVLSIMGDRPSAR